MAGANDLDTAMVLGSGLSLIRLQSYGLMGMIRRDFAWRLVPEVYASGPGG